MSGKKIVISFLLILLAGCGKESAKDPKRNSVMPKANQKARPAAQPSARVKPASAKAAAVPFKASDLRGVWKLTEIRLDPRKTGLAPVGGELLIQFQDKALAWATNGQKELAKNIKGIPTTYRIEDNHICADDPVFKLVFKSNRIALASMDQRHMTMIIPPPSPELPEVYRHFVRVK